MTDAPTENPTEAPVAESPRGENPAEAPAQAPATEAPGAEAPAAEAPAAEAPAKPAKKAAAKKAPAKKTAAKKTAAKKSAAKPTAEPAADASDADGASDGEASAKPAKKAPAKKATAKKTAARKTAAKTTSARPASKAKAKPADTEQLVLTPEDEPAADAAPDTTTAAPAEAPASAAVLFQAPKATTRKRSAAKPKSAKAPAEEPVEESAELSAEESTEAAEDAAAPTEESAEQPSPAADPATDDTDEESGQESGQEDDEESDDEESEGADGSTGPARRRRRRGGRRRRKPAGAGQGGGEDDDIDGEPAEGAEGAEGGTAEGETGESEDSGDDAEASENGGGGQGSSSSRRRRRRRRAGEGGGDDGGDDPENTVTRVRKPRSADDEITSISGSTRLEAKKQRRREGREAGRRRAPIVSEAEFLARRESVERVMAIRQRKDLTQIAVLEDKVLVEHYVARESQTSLIGNVYLGRVQNVLPSMEAAFIDIGKGRNAVLYAGEVNWAALGHKEGQPRKIESVLQSGQTVLVQVTKDPIGHKGARLTSQVSLAGRFLVYVPDGTTSGISRKLPDTERGRLKTLLKEIVPDTAGVIVRTAAEGASEDELTRDVERLKARWEDIEAKVAKGNAPQLLYGEPDLTLKVVRDLFTEDFAKLVVQGDEAWATVKEYVDHVAPDLVERLEQHPAGDDARDLFATYRIDEQIAKGLDRKVWLPSGGSLIIDRTEAMTVVDVNTGKFTGSGGNLEETVTKNNLEAAEEIVRQLRLRDIGGIIVVDFIDMVLESNRDLVLRRLVECLGRDRTRHQVAEVTSLGLVQMTRKRIGTGLLEAFSENCSHCQGRGIVVHDLPVEPKRGGNQGGGESSEESRRTSRRRKGRGQGGENGAAEAAPKPVPSPKDVAAMAKHHDEAPADDVTEPVEDVAVAEVTEAAPTEGAPTEAAVEAVEAVVEEAPVETPAPVDEAVADEPVAEEPVAAAEEQAVEVAAALEEPEAVVPEPEPEPEPEPAPESEPEPVATATVVTRTRTRRSAATRPAGPPVATEAAAEAGADAPAEQSEAGTGADQPAEEPHVEHVPIKKKGARKR